jgi:TDG/mug DNA glycosylase family protein
LTFGIGLTDLVAHEAGNDDAITFDSAARERLEVTILKYQPSFMCFNGKRSAKEFLQVRSLYYGLQSRRIGATQLFVAPSTSGAASRSWDLSPWQQLASLVAEAAA